jgi:hypothetical protein
MLTSERIDKLTGPAELFYRRLMSVVDDHGRFFANPKLLRSAAFPLKDSEQVPESCITAWLAECEAVDLVVVYEAKGTRYVCLQDFGQRTYGKSKFPDPPGVVVTSPESPVDHGEPQGTTALDVDVDVDVSEDVGVGGPRKRVKTRKHPIPADFVISDRVKAWAAAKGHTRLIERFDHFVSAAKARGYEYADWDEAFMGAVRDDWAKLNGKASPSIPGGGRRELGKV